MVNERIHEGWEVRPSRMELHVLRKVDTGVESMMERSGDGSGIVNTDNGVDVWQT